jgi:hypothetical protein
MHEGDRRQLGHRAPDRLAAPILLRLSFRALLCFIFNARQRTFVTFGIGLTAEQKRATHCSLPNAASLVLSARFSIGVMLKPLHPQDLVMLLAPRCLNFYGSPLSLAD